MPKDNTQQYTPLLSDPDASPTVDLHEKRFQAFEHASSSRRTNLIFFGVFSLQAVVILFLAGTLYSMRKPEPSCALNHFPQTLYSPAQGEIENVNKVFSMGFGETKTIYQRDPSPEVDKAWLDLYNWFGLSQIPKEQARLLPNKTLAIPADPEYYAVGLSVFHQLHCLNLIRQGLSPEHYTDPVTGAISNITKEEWPDHMSHCVDNIRQSIMCASDISLIVWQWEESINSATIAMDTIHSCRNFDRIADWAKEHRRTTRFNMSMHIEDDIQIPIIH